MQTYPYAVSPSSTPDSDNGDAYYWLEGQSFFQNGRQRGVDRDLSSLEALVGQSAQTLQSLTPMVPFPWFS